MAVLLIKRKELDVDITVALVDGGRLPGHLTCVRQHGLCHKRDVVVTIRAVDKDRMHSASEKKVNVSTEWFSASCEQISMFPYWYGNIYICSQDWFQHRVRRGRYFNGMVWKHLYLLT